MRNNLPPRDGALVTFVNGRPFLRSNNRVPYRVDQDRALVARWAAIAESDRGQVQTPVGPVEFSAVPLQDQGRTRGVFLAIVFLDPARAELESAIRATGAVGLIVLALGSVLAWRLAAGVVRPISALTDTARTITESDLSRRINVDGDDEIAQLAATFNHMLDRLESAFEGQRRLIDDAGHELRTPLTVVQGHLELLGDDPDEREEVLAIVGTSSTA
jgi:signal transduction histidine kinase